MATLKVSSLGEYIREQRESAQVSLRQLAKTAGVSNPYLSQIERGMKKPSADILAQIAKGLRISAETLYVHAGILDEREPSDVVAAILADPAIGERHRRILLDVYTSFRAEHAADVIAHSRRGDAQAKKTSATKTREETSAKQASAKKAQREEGVREEGGRDEGVGQEGVREEGQQGHPDPHHPHPVKEFHMSITRSKPFYAVAGVTDAAVKSLREVPAKLPTVRIERKDVEKAVEKAVANLQAEAVALPSKAQSTAVGLAGEVVGRADSVYTDLVVRGRSVVDPDPSPEGQPGPLGQRRDDRAAYQGDLDVCAEQRRRDHPDREEGGDPHQVHRRQEVRHHAQHRQVGHHVGPQDGRVGCPRDHRRRRQARPLTTTVAAPAAPARPSRRRPHVAGGGATRLCPRRLRWRDVAPSGRRGSQLAPPCRDLVAGDGGPQSATAVNIQQP